MDYRETCRCGSEMATADADADEARHMANIWRKYHHCGTPRVNEETGEITGDTIREWVETE